MTLDIERLDAAIDRAITNKACVDVAPGELREALRLARIGRDWESAVNDVRPPHVDDGA